MYVCMCAGPSHDPPTVCVAKHQANAAQHPEVKNVTRSRMLLKSHKPGDPDSSTEEIPAEAFLCKRQVHLYVMYLSLGSQFSQPGSVKYSSPISTDSF
jgi:hypothetical protein